MKLGWGVTGVSCFFSSKNWNISSCTQTTSSIMQHWKRVFYYKKNLTRTISRLAILANSKIRATLTRSSYWMWRQFLCLTYPFSTRQKNFIHTRGETFNLRMNVFSDLLLLISKRGFTSHFIELLYFCLISIPSQKVNEKKKNFEIKGQPMK